MTQEIYERIGDKVYGTTPVLQHCWVFNYVNFWKQNDGVQMYGSLHSASKIDQI